LKITDIYLSGLGGFQPSTMMAVHAARLDVPEWVRA
jgi:hypothetical protein